MFRLLALISFSLLIGSSLVAQPMQPKLQTDPKLEGQLMEEDSENPLPFATIILYSENDSSMVGNALTNEAGRFEMPLPPGEHFLVAQFVGYEDKVVSEITRTKNKNTVNLGTIEMAQEAVALNEVEVTAQRSQMQLKLDRRVFNVAEDLSNLGGTAADILDNVPSLTVDAEGNLSLRGSQGVRILINGRPSGLLSGGDTDALRQMQGDMIERVEVITNPSARYEAEGEAGIVNIVLKKEEDKGLNGSFGLSAGFPENFSGSYNLNYRRNAFNFFSNFGLNYRRSPGGGFTEQKFFSPDGVLQNEYFIDNDRNRSGYGGNIQLGMDWNISELDMITATGLYRTGRDNSNSVISYRDFDGNNNLLRTSRRDNTEDEEDHTVEFTLNYLREFDEEDRKFTVDFTFINDDDTELAEYLESTSESSDILRQRSSNTEDERNIILQTDYVHPLGEDSKFEAGARAALRTVNNNFVVEEEGDDGTFTTLSNFDDFLRYTENVYAAYLIGATKLFDAINFQAGLRVEHSDVEAALLRSNQTTPQNYTNLFPSASVSYEFTPKTQLQASYSRRLSRPYFRRLLPFSGLQDDRNINQGNPNLRPEYTDSYEMGVVQYLERGSILASVYYRRTTGVITRITLPGENGTSLRIPINLSEQDAYGVEITTSYDLTPWWSVNADVNLFQSFLNGSFEGTDFSNEAFVWNGRIDSRLTFGDVEIQPSFNYRGPRPTPQGRSLSSYAFNIGIAIKVLKGRGDLVISGRDLFNTRIRRTVIDLPEFESDGEFQWRRTQGVNVSFNYRLRK